MPDDLIFFRLNSDETELLVAQAGVGGFQQRFSTLIPRLDRDAGTIRINDADLGKIVRYCSYGPGGWQGDLRKIFLRSIQKLLAGNRERP